ncbi:molybdate ABC transporter substrate-binding protein [cyanobacterium endosymbiont of Epithemia clementina EcSB]|nr:molybdate ABC transporter substrate-binding protein [cyanobacterium endosymbiont of Epithemia clementina EcSB]WGT67786.1 molybdate ABC transporter substrate-binding protein [cyanobacterium endosymbiont of Epithemia clementina EcSB]
MTTACTNKKQHKIDLTISAASSVQDAMKDIRVLYRKETPNVNINYNFGSSGSLQQQIEQGAPTDVFLSAAPKQMNALQRKKLLLTETRQDLLKNRIVLITLKETVNNVTFNNLNKAEFKKVALGDPASVPAGQYGKEVLSSLELYKKIDSKLVFGKNTRQILFYVETGNVDAGLVYETDVRVSDKVKIVDIAPESYHSPIIYPISVIRQSKHPEEAKKFTEFLFSEKVKNVFKNYGFSLVKD